MPGITTWAADLLASTPAIKLLVALLLLCFIASSIRAWHRLRHIKGPFLASFSYLWLLHSTSKNKQAESFRDIIDEYGPLVRIGPNDLITSDVEIIRCMGRTNSKPAYSRSSWYSAMKVDPYHDSLISTRNTLAHDKLKAKMSFGYGGRENPSLEEGTDTQLSIFVDLIRRKYISAGAEFKPIDMAIATQCFTLDSLSQVAYGNAFGFLATDSDMFDYVSESKKLLPVLVLSAEVPWAGRIFMSPTFLRFLGPKPTNSKGFGKMLKYASSL